MTTIETIILDAATADAQPTPFEVNDALYKAGIADLRVRELLDRKLHVFDETGAQRLVMPLDVYAERLA